MTAHPAVRLLHDMGAATWFGGTLAGATALNGAATVLDDPSERSRISTAGWSQWAPVGAAGVAAHVIGAAGLLVTDWPRVKRQQGVARSSAVKAAVTAAGLGVHGWSIVLNRKMAAAGAVPVSGATEPGAQTPEDVAATQRQLQLVQWLQPLLAGAVIATGSWQSEQQRTAQVVPGVAKRMVGSVPGGATVVAAAALGVAGAARARRRRRSGQEQSEVYPTPPAAESSQPTPHVVDLTDPARDAEPRPVP